MNTREFYLFRNGEFPSLITPSTGMGVGVYLRQWTSPHIQGFGPPARWACACGRAGGGARGRQMARSGPLCDPPLRMRSTPSYCLASDWDASQEGAPAGFHLGVERPDSPHGASKDAGDSDDQASTTDACRRHESAREGDAGKEDHLVEMCGLRKATVAARVPHQDIPADFGSFRLFRREAFTKVGDCRAAFCSVWSSLPRRTSHIVTSSRNWFLISL